MRPEETFDFQIRKSWIAIAKMYNDVVEPYGLTMAMGFALLNIDVKEGTPSTALGPKMGMESTSLSRLLKNMEAAGWIYRESHPSDRRSVLIKLTPAGLAKRKTSRDTVLEFNQRVLQVLTEAERDAFFGVVEKIDQVVGELRGAKVE